MKNKLEEVIAYLKNNFKTILFLFVFACVCVLYNQNFEKLNYVLNRGLVLEYSVTRNQINDEQIEKLDNKLKELDLKNSKISNLVESFDGNKTSLSVVIYQKPANGVQEKINEISDFIFDMFPKANLLEIYTLNNVYSQKYSAFLNFLCLLVFSSGIWLILLYLICDTKKLNEKFKTNILNFIETYKQKGKGLILNFKEKFKEILLSFKECGIKGIFARLFEEDDKEESPSKTLDCIKEIINTLVFVIVAVILIRYFVGELRWIPSGSMRPTIIEKDRVFVEKLKYPVKEVKRGDILVFYPPEVKLSHSLWAIFARYSGIFCRDIAYIKRVVGLPGDKFEVKYKAWDDEFEVLINDEPLDEPYINSKTNWTPCNKQMFCGPFVIPENHYFMMGDNRGNSQDSRFWGFLDKNRVIGRANFMFFPISRINILRDNYFDLKQNKTGKIRKYIVNRYEFLL